jgi:hypothetical protein
MSTSQATSNSTVNSANFTNQQHQQQAPSSTNSWGNLNLSGSSFPIAFSELPVLTSLTASQEALFTSSSSFDIEEEKNSSPFTSSDTAIEEDSSSSTPSSPPFVRQQQDNKSISQMLDQVNARFENLLDLPQIYLTDTNSFGTTTNAQKVKLQLSNISKSKSILSKQTIGLLVRYNGRISRNHKTTQIQISSTHKGKLE